ncbi:MAG: hypothetical protein J3Q66DRAFT_365248 [Benniella sp.]|nr:MAG: hypothetical protein J3Q66DRAFT_365248 [Benniella sp.]
MVVRKRVFIFYVSIAPTIQLCSWSSALSLQIYACFLSHDPRGSVPTQRIVIFHELTATVTAGGLGLGGRASSGFRTKHTHVDMLSIYFGPLKSWTFGPYSKTFKDARHKKQKLCSSRYKAVVLHLDKLLSAHLDKDHATLHWDGQPSLQKSSER